TQLPIEEVIPGLKEKLIGSNTVILQAPPGAGKSTFLPLQLLNESWLKGKKILMLEPRRLAARTVAARLASLLEEEVGETIGYRIRFEKKVSDKTKLEILTEGILTRMLQDDNSLENIGLIIFDEFHERSIHADLALAICREIQSVLRNDLRILIMSATLDGEKLSSLLNNAPIITSKGRQHPITFHYTGNDEQTPIHLQVSRIIRRALSENKGDILAFLPGAGEISRVAEDLDKEKVNGNVVPLFGDLSIQKQQEAIMPDKYGNRKIVLATSIAETSLTIEGITVVVDCGYSRVPRFDPASGLTKLQTIRVTKDAADQRAGRAGRLGPGVCYRLWTEGYNHHLIPHRSPEIEESDLASLVLEVAKWNSGNIFEMAWITPPPRGAVAQAKELLGEIGAFENDRITEKGKAILKFPAHPRIANMILSAEENGKGELAADIAALLEERDPLERGKSVDLALRIELLNKWRKKERVNADSRRLEQINRSAENWKRLLKNKNNKAFSHYDCGELIAHIFPERVAKKIGPNKYRLANGKVGVIPENDELTHEEYIAVANLDAGQKGEAKIFLAAALDENVLRDIAVKKRISEWDEKKGELNVSTEWRVGEIILQRTPEKNIPAEERIPLLIEAIKKDPQGMLRWNNEFREMQKRVMSLRKWNAVTSGASVTSSASRDEFPDLSDEHLIATMEEWLSPYLENVRRKEDMLKIDLYAIHFSSILYQLQKMIDELAPEKIEVPSGSFIRLEYFSDGKTPVLAVRLQELFGMLQTPAINNGKMKLMIHLLSPAYRPVQVTQDLESFWKNTYTDVRKDLRSRYPKHSWPEDPYTAKAVRGVKRK
ncbi:MAG TPA: ATP-dependent helicase HrpB, partial [Bacteroidia bacterium]|nr:ATP-dependent helicase HrpB [Bacteroidia bacterium]